MDNNNNQGVQEINQSCPEAVTDKNHAAKESPKIECRPHRARA